MKGFLKRFAVFGVLLAALSLCLSACGDNGNTADGTTVYKITVTCEDTMVPDGVKVQMKKSDGTVAAEKTPENGVASFTLESGSYSVVLAELPSLAGLLADYSYAQTTVTAENPNATVEIVPLDTAGETIVYSLTVNMPDGSPAADLTVQLCGGPKGMCNIGMTDGSGKAVFNLPAGEYEVHIDNPPQGTKFDNAEYKMTSAGGDLTIVLRSN